MVVTVSETNRMVLPGDAGAEIMTLGQYLHVGIIITEQVAEGHYSLTSKK